MFEIGSLGMLGVTWLTFAFGALVSFFIQVKRGLIELNAKELFRHSFPVEKIISKSSRMDVVFYILSKFMEHLSGPFYFVIQIYLATLLSGALNSIFGLHLIFNVDYFGAIAFAIILFLFADFANFLSHYLQHFVPVLWELHKVHHSATFMTPLTTKRMHPLGNEFYNIVAAAFVILPMSVMRSISGLDFVQMGLLLSSANMFGTIIVLDALRHSPFQINFGPLDRIFLSPMMHQIHHSYLKEHWDRNFGNKLSIWDGLFGTAVYPAPGEATPWGLGKPEEEDYNSLSGAFAGPIVKIYRLVTARTPEDKTTAADATYFERVIWRKRKG